VTVEDEECEDEGGICEIWPGVVGVSATGGDDGSSLSGLAIRSPPM
jgi:hypothetical protein